MPRDLKLACRLHAGALCLLSSAWVSVREASLGKDAWDHNRTLSSPEIANGPALKGTRCPQHPPTRPAGRAVCCLSVCGHVPRQGVMLRWAQIRVRFRVLSKRQICICCFINMSHLAFKTEAPLPLPLTKGCLVRGVGAMKRPGPWRLAQVHDQKRDGTDLPSKLASCPYAPDMRYLV